MPEKQSNYALKILRAEHKRILAESADRELTDDETSNLTDLENAILITISGEGFLDELEEAANRIKNVVEKKMEAAVQKVQAKTERIPVKFNGLEGILYKGMYKNMRTALIIAGEGYPDALGSEIIAVATLNVPEVYLLDEWVILKTYSENEGIEKALEPTGILKQRISDIDGPGGIYPIYELDLEILSKCPSV